MPRMKSVQVAKPNANLEIVERDIPDPKRARSASKYKRAVYVTATCSL